MIRTLHDSTWPIQKKSMNIEDMDVSKQRYLLFSKAQLRTSIYTPNKEKKTFSRLNGSLIR